VNDASDTLRPRLGSTRNALLDVHTVLLEEERVRYESEQGRIQGSYHFLQLVISDPFFDWLRPMSRLVVRIDEFLTARIPAPDAEGNSLLEEAEFLLRKHQR
jgi:hypothetical protein